jgi:hypothetical protein
MRRSSAVSPHLSEPWRPIASRRGNALIITLLLLLTLTAIGIFAVSLTTKEIGMATQAKVGAILRNTAESGVYFGIGQLPTLYVSGAPYNGSLNVGANGMVGTYSVTSSMTGALSVEPGYGANYRFSNFTVSSVAQAPSGFTGSARIDAEVRFGPVPAGTGY